MTDPIQSENRIKARNDWSGRSPLRRQLLVKGRGWKGICITNENVSSYIKSFGALAKTDRIPMRTVRRKCTLGYDRSCSRRDPPDSRSARPRNALFGNTRASGFRRRATLHPPSAAWGRAGRCLRCKIRYRIFLRFFNQIVKLWRARSRLYQSKILQPNTHFAAFFEIYKISNPLHQSKLIFSEIVHQTFPIFIKIRGLGLFYNCFW